MSYLSSFMHVLDVFSDFPDFSMLLISILWKESGHKVIRKLLVMLHCSYICLNIKKLCISLTTMFVCTFV